MNLLPNRDEIIQFVNENPGQYSPGQVAKIFHCDTTTMYRFKDKYNLPFKEAKPNTIETAMFSWRNYRNGVI